MYTEQMLCFRKDRLHVSRLFTGFLMTACVSMSLSMDLVPGHIYSNAEDPRTILHFTASGAFVDSYTMPSSFPGGVRGLAFGPNGFLYVTLNVDQQFRVVAIDQMGAIRESYLGSGGIGGNSNYGKLAFGTNDTFYVGSQTSLYAFTLGSPNGTAIYSNNGVQDVESLPNGNLLVLSNYELEEITQTGSVVRSISPSVRLVDARGVEFDPVTDSIYVSMLGSTSQHHRVMRMESASGVVTALTTYANPADLYLTHERSLLVGSRFQPVGVFDLNLQQMGAIGPGEQWFVTQMPVPEPGSLITLAVALLAYAKKARRNRHP